jgi:hypothetical protein
MNHSHHRYNLKMIVKLQLTSLSKSKLNENTEQD